MGSNERKQGREKGLAEMSEPIPGEQGKQKQQWLEIVQLFLERQAKRHPGRQIGRQRKQEREQLFAKEEILE